MTDDGGCYTYEPRRATSAMCFFIFIYYLYLFMKGFNKQCSDYQIKKSSNSYVFVLTSKLRIKNEK